VAAALAIAAAAARGVGIYGASPYCLQPPARTGFILGYARLAEGGIREGIRRLGAVL